MYRKYKNVHKEILFILYHDSLAQLFSFVCILYSLTFIFWGDNLFRITLLYVELYIGLVTFFTGLAVSLYAINLGLTYYGRLNGEKTEILFKCLMCLLGCFLSCFFVGLIWDWIASTYYVVVTAPVDMKWFLWEFFVVFIIFLTQIDTFCDLRELVVKINPNVDVPKIGQLALAEGYLNELQINQIEHQQYLWKKRAFARLMRQYSRTGKKR